MSNGGLKITRIKAQNKEYMRILDETLHDPRLTARTPRIASVAEARSQYKNYMNTIQKLGAHTDATGFDPKRSFQYVANIDSSIWSAVLSVFARYDEAGNLIDEGLLYKTDPNDGQVKLNRDFFYALLSGPLKDFDMRGKVSIV